MTLFWLLAGHALADFAIQPDAMARGKSRHFVPRQAESRKAETIWPYWLTSHALIHGAAVALATGCVPLGIAETVAHWLIDFGKCEDWYGFHVDQAAHVACKLAWAVWLVA
jgi:hypothetical protein